MMFIGLLLACTTELLNKDKDWGTAETIIAAYSDYQTWQQPEGWSEAISSHGVHGTTVQIWMNTIASSGMDADVDFEQGSVLIKEGYADEEGVQLISQLWMVKQEAWFWVSASPEGDILEYGAPSYCLSCHSRATHDFVLFLENP